MPDRIIRDELLESERWLSLKDNADRLAYLALLLRADSLGNFTAEPFRLMRLWRDFGISTLALVSKTVTELADHDLVRCYQVDDKSFVHIPRFGQRNTRYIKRVCPQSPWTTDEQKQRLADNSQCEHSVSTPRAQRAHVRDKKRREENNPLSKKRPLDAPVHRPAWFTDFWTAYPRREAKQAAMRAWDNLKPEAELMNELMPALERAKQSPGWMKDNGKFIPLPASWLNGRRWEDEKPREPVKRFEI